MTVHAVTATATVKTVSRHTRRRSLAIAYLYKANEAGDETLRAQQEFTSTLDRENLDHYLRVWEAARRTECRYRRMWRAANGASLRRSRHTLMLAEARRGSVPLEVLDWVRNSPSELANDSELDERTEVLLYDEDDPGPDELLDSFTVDDIGAHAPPSSFRPSMRSRAHHIRRKPT
jgi:ribosomal protein L25 (general stress protein Ctc)